MPASFKCSALLSLSSFFSASENKKIIHSTAQHSINFNWIIYTAVLSSRNFQFNWVYLRKFQFINAIPFVKYTAHIVSKRSFYSVSISTWLTVYCARIQFKSEVRNIILCYIGSDYVFVSFTTVHTTNHSYQCSHPSNRQTNGIYFIMTQAIAKRLIFAACIHQTHAHTHSKRHTAIIMDTVKLN